MERILKNKKLLFSFGGVLVLLLVIGVILFFSFKKNEEKPNVDAPITDVDFTQDVTPEEAEGMYKELIQDCTGALVFDLQVGDEVSLDGVPSGESCRNDDHYSKMFGYTYDLDGNMIMHVKILKREGDQLYNLEGVSVGAYDESKLNTLLDYGSTYVYTYQKNGEIYKLSKVEYARPVTNDLDDTDANNQE